jgi:hypothetical protein
VIRASVCVVLCAASCAACAGRHGAVAGAQRQALQPCETRVVTFDGVHVIVTANADGTPETVGTDSDDGPARERALRDAEALFGAPHRDLDAVARSSKFGPATLTDRCGRPLPMPQRPVR